MNTESYWIASAALPNFPRPTGDVTVDAVVIGGGITGVTSAYLLKKAGLKVALLDRGRFAQGDTGHTTAHLTSVTDLRLQDIARTFGDDAARAVWDAGGAAIDQIVTAIREEDIECDFRWVPGYLHAPLGETEGRFVKELKEEAEVADRLGISATYADRIPAFDVPGVKFPHQAIFHPRKYLTALLRSIEGDGCHVFESASADQITEKPLVVRSGSARLKCRYLVIATHNPMMGNTSAVAATLFQTKLALYTSYAMGAELPVGRIPEASFWDTSDPYYYLRVERRGDRDYVIFGGEDHKTGQVEDTAEVYRRLREKLLSFAPDAVIDHQWSGQVIETNDGLPFIGETAENQFAATGFAGNGMSFGTLSAMMAVDAVTRRKNPWSGLFDIHRKKLLGGTWTYLAENKDYPYYLIRNWLAQGDSDSLDTLNPGEGRILKLKGKKVAAYRDEAGRVSLCSPICTHLKCIVGWNNAERTWDCPCHGSRFKPAGEVLSGPAEEPLSRVNEDGRPLERT
jgi:glycine/D-amino acid oxidase-like deaminating enzyme/nitrite reductase/ring-hydroxylating ferredoxin subunit